ncbi:MAG TPA: alkaline phosphatase family protein [Kofleriaceae bacterium]|nr:alkaline phosphatase family protein [Kofleriaceae bacterium]
MTPARPTAAAAAVVALALALAAGTACSPPPPAARRTTPTVAPKAAAAAAPIATPPRLVVLVIVDQLPAWAFLQKRPQLTGGFDRLLREGEWHTGEHPSAAAITAPGHAVISTGEPPATSGILANQWYRRAQDRLLASVQDPDAPGAASARWLRVPGIADAVAAAGTGAKAVSVSLKDRAAILSLGRAGLPIWYDRKAVAWTSTAPPAWLAEHNRKAPIAARLKERWTADPRRLAALSGTTDDQPGEAGEAGFGPTFPHDMTATKEPAYALLATPTGNQVVLDAALAAIDGESLGQDATPDLLVLSFSAHDYVGHGWGHESWEAWDMMLRLDEQLGRFLEALDQKVGAGQWAMLVTSDHGASPLPERAGGGRITYESIRESANRAASTALGLGDWIADTKFPSVYLSAAARARTARDQQRAIAKIVYALRSYPGLGRVERTLDVAGNCEQRTGDTFLICLALDPVESGEVFYMPARGWIMQEAAEPLATGHGSLHAYDREVPLLLVPPDRKSHAPLTAPSEAKIQMVRVPIILARWLGVAPPQKLPR